MILRHLWGLFGVVGTVLPSLYILCSLFSLLCSHFSFFHFFLFLFISSYFWFLPQKQWLAMVADFVAICYGSRCSMLRLLRLLFFLCCTDATHYSPTSFRQYGAIALFGYFETVYGKSDNKLSNRTFKYCHFSVIFPRTKSNNSHLFFYFIFCSLNGTDLYSKNKFTLHLND